MKHSIIFIVYFLICSTLFSCKDPTNDTTPQLEASFEGITETIEKGPEPIGSIDADDWKSLMNCSSIPKISNATDTSTVIPKCTQIFPAYPNPANKSFAVSFSINETDSVILTLNSTPSKVVKELLKQRLLTGTYSIMVDGSDLPPQIYRIYISVYRANDVLTSYGDVKLVH